MPDGSAEAMSGIWGRGEERERHLHPLSPIFSLATLLAAPGDPCSREEAQQERQAGPAKSSWGTTKFSSSLL